MTRALRLAPWLVVLGLVGSSCGSSSRGAPLVAKNAAGMVVHFDRVAPACGLRVAPGGEVEIEVPLDLPGGIGVVIEWSLRREQVLQPAGKTTVFSTEQARQDLRREFAVLVPDGVQPQVYELWARAVFRRHTEFGGFDECKIVEGRLAGIDLVVTRAVDSHPIFAAVALTYGAGPAPSGAAHVLPLPDSNSVTVGGFQGTLDDGRLRHVAQGGSDAFLHLQRREGDTLTVRTFGGPGDDRATAAVLGGDGSVWMGGVMEQTVVFGSGARETLTVAGAAGFVVRFRGVDVDGAIAFDGVGDDSVEALVAVPGSADVLVLGTYANGMVVGPGAEDLAGTSGTFLLRLDANFRPVWAARLSGDGPVVGTDLRVLESGVVAVCGRYGGKLQMTHGATTKAQRTSFRELPEARGEDVFLVTYDLAGRGRGAVGVGGPGVDTCAALVSGVASGGGSVVVVGGAFANSFDPNVPGQPPLPALVGTGRATGFVAGYRIPSSGIVTAAVWAKAQASTAHSAVLDVDLESRGFGPAEQFVLVLGDFEGDVVVGSGELGETHLATPRGALFLAKMRLADGGLFYADDWGQDLEAAGLTCFSVATNRFDHSYMVTGRYRTVGPLDCTGRTLPPLGAGVEGSFFLRYASEPR